MTKPKGQPSISKKKRKRRELLLGEASSLGSSSSRGVSASESTSGENVGVPSKIIVDEPQQHCPEEKDKMDLAEPSSNKGAAAALAPRDEQHLTKAERKAAKAERKANRAIRREQKAAMQASAALLNQVRHPEDEAITSLSELPKSNTQTECVNNTIISTNDNTVSKTLEKRKNKRSAVKLAVNGAREMEDEDQQGHSKDIHDAYLSTTKTDVDDTENQSIYHLEEGQEEDHTQGKNVSVDARKRKPSKDIVNKPKTVKKPRLRRQCTASFTNNIKTPYQEPSFTPLTLTPDSFEGDEMQLSRASSPTLMEDNNSGDPAFELMNIPRMAPKIDNRTLSATWKSKSEDKSDNNLQEKHTFVSGPFSLFEQNKVEEAVNSYLLENNLDRDALPFLANARKYVDDNNLYTGHKNFYDEVIRASELNRTRSSLGKYIQRRYDPGLVSGRFTEAEDAELLRLYELKSGKWTEIEKLMGRHGCRERYRVLAAKQKKANSGAWTAQETKAFFTAVQNYMEKKSVESVFDSGKIDWNVISKEVKTRDSRQCMFKWVSNGKKLFDEDPSLTFSREHYLHLIETLSKIHNVTDDYDIKWDQVAKALHTTHQLTWTARQLRVRFVALRRNVEDPGNKTWKETLDYMASQVDVLIARKNRGLAKTVSREECVEEDDIGG